jgi:hypothetical protein
MSAAASDYCILVASHTRLLAVYVIGQLKWLLLFPLDKPLSDWAVRQKTASRGGPQPVMVAGGVAR